MKALILAGGFATRLRPLSCSKPKLLFPMVGLPLVDRIVGWLSKADIGEVVLAVNHLSEKLQAEVASRDLGSRVVLSVENNPLGTGGPLRLAAPLLSPKEPLIVVNGDVVTDVDVRKLLARHLASGAQATVALVWVKDPRPFGLADLDSNERIIGFEEKSLKRPGPGWINAGVYALNPSVFEMIPDGRSVSLEREIFPILAKRQAMSAWKHGGYWYDIGKTQDYVLANRALLKDRSLWNDTTKGPKHVGQIEEPTFVAANCKIEKNVRLGPDTILSRSVRIGAHCTVRRTIAFEETTIGSNCVIDDTVIGERVTIANGVKIGAGSVIAGQITIPEETEIRPGSIILS